VFHPRYFLTSEFFADFLSGTDLVGKWVAGVGMGSAILALAAARAGAASVVAVDINSNACNEREPQRHNGSAQRSIGLTGESMPDRAEVNSAIVWGRTRLHPLRTLNETLNEWLAAMRCGPARSVCLAPMN
jgi:hypothetical protein